MEWNRDISLAPLGHMETRQRTVKGQVHDYEEFVPDHIIAASVCGKVTRSYWIPKEGRWCMFMAGSPPIAWMYWPKHPSAE